GLRILFVKESQNWPRASGNDVHGFHMMRAAADRGHAVSLATITPPTPRALEGLALAGCFGLSGPGAPVTLTPWQARLAGYFGIKDEWYAALAEIIRSHRFDVVVLVAQHLLPLLSAVRG